MTTSRQGEALCPTKYYAADDLRHWAESILQSGEHSGDYYQAAEDLIDCLETLPTHTPITRDGVIALANEHKYKGRSDDPTIDYWDFLDAIEQMPQESPSTRESAYKKLHALADKFDGFIEQCSPESPWHPASEPPDDDRDVLVVYTGDLGDTLHCIGCYTAIGNWQLYEFSDHSHLRIIWWTELPQPPTDTPAEGE